MMDKLWIKAQKNAEEKYETENGNGSWNDADRYEREDWCMSEYEQLKKEKENKGMTQRDSKGRFVKSNVATNNTTNSNKEENKTMTNSRENRMAALNNAGINTQNFFDVNVKVPMGSSVTITIDGVPYTVNTVGNTNVVESIRRETPVANGFSNVSINNNANCDTSFNGCGSYVEDIPDKVVQKIMEQGYVFNRKTDGRWVTAQTFRMLNETSYNYLNGWRNRKEEQGWDAYLRNNFVYMYQFSMVADELHRLARMEKQNDPEFNRLSRFFTKEVVIALCEQYVRQLNKFVKHAPSHKCKGVPYVKLNRFGNVYLKDLQSKVYQPLEDKIEMIKISETYYKLEASFKFFTAHMCKLPYNTAKCPEWKDAFKGKGAYVTLLNIIKFHGLKVVDPETGEVYNMYESVNYVENKADEYADAKQNWRMHELLKYEIETNKFDLRKSIESQK